MIPFEREVSLTETEKVAEEILESNWDYVVRATPGIFEDLKHRYTEIGKLVSEKATEDGVEDLGNVFRPGVPDFLCFDSNGDYCFIEVKGEGDGLRHSQLQWLKDFKGLKTEIWFADSNEKVTEKINANVIQATSLKPSRSKGEAVIREHTGKGKSVSLPENLAAIMDLEEGNKVSWNIKNETELVLDTK